MAEKLSKKELKSLQHKAKGDEKAKAKLEAYEAAQEEKRNTEKRKLEEETLAAQEAARIAAETPKKKRKTRRGKGGRTASQGGFKATLFVGNLPKDSTEEDIRKHFASAAPFNVRMRLEKGFAFVEFVAEGETPLDKAEIHRRTQMALLLHHTKLGARTINVELSAGGGGNSATRREKITKKNEDAERERKRRIARENKAKGITEPVGRAGVNPERAHLIDREA